MPSHQRNHTTAIRWLLFVCLLYSGSSLEAQIEAPTPVPTQEAPSKSNGTSGDSELKIHNYQLKHAKAAEVLKLFKQLHGGENTATIDERTNSIVFLANETNARELRESLALLDGDAPHPIIPPTPVVQGHSPQSPVPAESQPRPEKSKPAGPFRKFIFKHAKVADVVKILRELTGANIDNENMEGFAVDERTNSVIWKVKDEWRSQHWEETLLTLDGESSTSTTQKTPSPYAPTPASGSAQPTQTLTFSMGLERGESLESLKQRYSELEQQTHQLADKLKQSKTPSEPELTKLKTAVRKSFEARQALQRAELADLARRMQSMQESIDMRDKLADKVIERRVEDLLNPSLNWESIQTSELVPTSVGEVDLSTPQATLDTIDRYSVDHPMGVPVECYTEPALQELSGVMLQQLCFMSGLSQIGLQTGGVIGVKDNVPMVAGTAPSFHLSVDALLKEHSLSKPPEESTKAFELLAKLTLGGAFSNEQSLVKPDRELLRLASGILKSPKDFLPKAAELSERFNDIPGDTDSPKKESKAQPKYLIEIDGDQATATQIVDSDKPSVPMSFKLQRINQRWLVSEAFSDEILNQMISSMSQVLGAMSAIESEVANQRDSSDSKKAPDAEGANNASPRVWDDFLKLLPETGTALVMFSYEPEIKEQMLPVAKKVAEAASAQLIELPQTTWHKIIAPPATHFVLMKDRQLVGTRTGLMTEARLQDFVAKAKDWLTPQSIGIDENSLVRIDCFISPGTDNIGSQHGGAYPLTTAVVAVHEDQALLFGPESIAEYIEKGYACVAVVRDASGNQKQVEMDVLLKGPVKLLGGDEKQPESTASMHVTFGDGTYREVPLPGVASIYPKSVTELLEAYDVGSAIYHIRGVQGLKPLRLAAIEDAPNVNQRVLSGSFTRHEHFPPIRYFRSPIYWQSQTVPKADGHIYGDNINGAEMFEVLCPTRPAPCGFTFNEHGRLVGRYGLGEPSEKDMTHTVFKPDTTHSVLHAALEKISDAGLKAALAQTLEESNTAAFIKEENSPAAGDAANASTLQSSTSPPIKFDTPQALLARVDECSNNGSYEEFVSLFSDEGVRDLAGSLIVSAMQVTTVTELAKQNGGDLGQGPARIQEALNRWLTPNPTPEQQQAASEALSLMFLVGFGGPIQDKSVIAAYVAGIRKNAERVTNFRKFSVDMLKAYHELTGEPFGYFGKEKDREWRVTQTEDKAVAKLVVKTEPKPATVGIGSNIAKQSLTSDGSEQLPVMTLTKLDGTWRISSLFDELLNVVEPNIEAPSAAAPE